MFNLRWIAGVVLALSALTSIASAETHTVLSPTDAQASNVSVQAGTEAVARRDRSNQRLTEMGIPVNQSLPLRLAAEDTVRRSGDEVVERLLALAVVAVHASEMDRQLTNNMIDTFRVHDAFTPEEEAFLAKSLPTREERAQYTWAFENVEVLLWAVGLRDELGHPGEVCDIDAIADTLLTNGSFGLHRRARLRSQEEIMDQADLIYRMHWALRQAQIDGEAAPAGMVWDVVYERHHALNWLIGYMDQSWDDVSADT